MQWGDFELNVVSGGRLRFDGGSMFGVVPKALWERKAPADEHNRIAMDTNCLLVRGGGRTMLVDTGYGTKLSAKLRGLFSLEEGDVLVENLARHGVQPQDVDTVILTHLHFDHAGGATRRNADGQLVPTFPQARHVVQRVEWDTAAGGARELGDAYPPENFLPLEETGVIELLDGDTDIAPGVRLQVTGGHTAGHQAVLIESGGRTAFCPVDLCPMRAHLKQLWCMAFDLFPLDSRRRKAEWLGRAADERWLVVWSHDPEVVAGYLQRDARAEFVVVQGSGTL